MAEDMRCKQCHHPLYVGAEGTKNPKPDTPAFLRRPYRYRRWDCPYCGTGQCLEVWPQDQ